VKLVWDESAWADYVWWQAQDRKILTRINTLITDIQRTGNEGIGKPGLQDRRGRDPDSSLSLPLRALIRVLRNARSRRSARLGVPQHKLGAAHRTSHL